MNYFSVSSGSRSLQTFTNMCDHEEENWSDADESMLARCDDTTKEDDYKPKDVFPLLSLSRKDYLCVTDLTNQLWCEQQMCYTLSRVEPQAHGKEDDSLPLPVADRPEVKAGKSLHLARELEIHDIVSVNITSKVDKWAIHILNLVQTLRGFAVGVPVAREVPVFGDPFGTGDFMFGIIDELRFDAENYAISLLELKTRKSRSMPGKAQRQQHNFQVLMYKQLWDNLIKGNFQPELFIEKLLSRSLATQTFSVQIMQHLESNGVAVMNISDLLSLLISSAQTLVCVASVEIEYIFQDNGESIGRTTVEEDADWVESTFHHCMELWHGKRGVKGVDLEDVWKCGFCEYTNMCEWRQKQDSLLSKRVKPE